MQSLKQDMTAHLEVHEEVWCVKCKGQGHDNDHCPVFVNYLTWGGTMLLRPEAQAGTSVVPALWCTIFQIGGKHATNNCHLLQKYTQNSQQLLCNFCRSVGHDEHTCRSYELMMDRTPAYRVQAETRPLDQNAGVARIRFQGHGRGRGGGGPGRGHRQLICYNCGGGRTLCPWLYESNVSIISVLYLVWSWDGGLSHTDSEVTRQGSAPTSLNSEPIDDEV